MPRTRPTSFLIPQSPKVILYSRAAAILLTVGLAAVAPAQSQPTATAPSSAAADNSRPLATTGVEATLITSTLDRKSGFFVALTPEAVLWRTQQGKAERLPRSEVLAVLFQSSTNTGEQARRASDPLNASEDPALNPLVDPLADPLRDLQPGVFPNPALDPAANPNEPLSDESRTNLSAPAILTGVLLTTDGQRLPGILEDTSATAPDRVHWLHPILGRTTLPLESVERILLNRSPLALATASTTTTSINPPTEDSVVLENNDTLRGYIASIGSQVKIEVGTGTAAAEQVIPSSRVTAINLTNTPVESQLPLITFHGGSKIRATIQSFTISDSGECAWASPLVGDPASGTPPYRAPLRDIAAFALSTIKARPLSGEVVGGTDDSKRLTGVQSIQPSANSPLGVRDIAMSGPCDTALALPAKTRRVAGVIDMPRSARVWGDCVVTLTLTNPNETPLLGTATWSGRINADTPTTSFSLSVSADTNPSALRVVIDAGENGPAQDRITLRDVLVLCDESPAAK